MYNIMVTVISMTNGMRRNGLPVCFLAARGKKLMLRILCQLIKLVEMCQHIIFKVCLSGFSPDITAYSFQFCIVLSDFFQTAGQFRDILCIAKLCITGDIMKSGKGFYRLY